MTFLLKNLARSFAFTRNHETILLPDPDPDMTPDEVMVLYANQFPELTTATVSGPNIEQDTSVYHFKTVLGTKG